MNRKPVEIPRTRPPGIALFDLDGTLLPWDCQLLFRHYVVRRQPWRIVFLPIFLLAVPLAPVLGTERMKRVFLAYLWRMRPEKLEELSAGFADFVMPSVYAELKARLELQRAAGHFTILASASPECYVRHIGRNLGFDLVLGTPVSHGPLFPPLVNHKGTRKVTRLREVLPADWFSDEKLPACHGYTDSTADLPMLELCHTATVVNPKPQLAEIAASRRWDVERPLRPWKTKADFTLRALALLFGIGKDPGACTGNSHARHEARSRS